MGLIDIMGLRSGYHGVKVRLGFLFGGELVEEGVVRFISMPLFELVQMPRRDE